MLLARFLRRVHETLHVRLQGGRALVRELHGVGDLDLDLRFERRNFALWNLTGEQRRARGRTEIRVSLELIELF